MYLVNQARSFFGYGKRDSDTLVSTESEDNELDGVIVDDGYGPSHNRYFKDCMDIEAIKEKLKGCRWPQEEKHEFINYCEWCIAKLEKGGLRLQSELAKSDGAFTDKFAKMVNARITNRLMSWSDKCSRQGRGSCALTRRYICGLNPKAGYAPEEGKDCFSIGFQTFGYLVLPLLQYIRFGAGLILAYGQAVGEYPPHNSTIDNASPLYENAGDALTYSTFACLVPILLFHTPPQLREFCRGNAELNVNELGALNCYKGAVDFMCGHGEQYSMQNFQYKFGLESYKKRATGTTRYDALRYGFSIFREIFGYPENVVLSGLSNITLSGARAYGPPGHVLTAASIFMLIQSACDMGQAWCERKSSEIKLQDIHETLDKLRNVLKDQFQAEPLTDFRLRCGVNNAAITFQKRQARYQNREYGFAIARMLKGGISGSFGLVALVHGAIQIHTGAKPPLALFFGSLVSVFVSGDHFIVSLIKMYLRNAEKMLKKRLFTNAAMARLQYNAEERLVRQALGTVDKFVDRQHLFQKRILNCASAEEERVVTYNDNEYGLLDTLTDYILEDLRTSRDSSRLEYELNKWLNESWGVPQSMIYATLGYCGDKAPVFQRDQLKQGLAALLNLPLPLGLDRVEKRIKPSLVVLNKMQLVKPEESDSGKSFDEVIKDFKPKVWPWVKEHQVRLFRGVLNTEELIASILHIYERGTAPADPDDRIKFGKLVAVAQVLAEERLVALEAVLRAKFEDFDFKIPKLPSGKRDELLRSFSDFQETLREYVCTSIFDRNKQLKHLKELTQNAFVQKLLELHEDPNWINKVKRNHAGDRIAGGDEPADSKAKTTRKANANMKAKANERKLLARGIEILVERVDLNQPLPPNIGSPRSEELEDVPMNITTRVPVEVLNNSREVSGESPLRESSPQSIVPKPARRGPRGAKSRATELSSNHSDGRPKEGVSTSTSKNKTPLRTDATEPVSKQSGSWPNRSMTSSTGTQNTTSSSQRTSARLTDEDALSEGSDTEVIVTLSDTDSEGETTQDTPRGVEEV